MMARTTKETMMQTPEITTEREEEVVTKGQRRRYGFKFHHSTVVVDHSICCACYAFIAWGAVIGSEV